MRNSRGLLLRLFPFLRWWGRVDRQTMRADAIAGITGALIVLPQGVAFATIAGLPPQYGLYAALMPAVVAALWGSSWHLVSGPTTAISIAVYAALSPLTEPGSAQYINLALTLTFLVGVFELTLGLARLGTLVNFVSHSVIIGFTTGAAILIAASQIRTYFGIPIPRGTPFYEVMHQLALQVGNSDPFVLTVATTTLITGVVTRRLLPRWPYMIVAMIVGSLLAALLNAIFGAETTGIRTVGSLPASLPPLTWPDLSIGALRQTLTPALVITMLALTEAISIARAIAVRSEQRVDGNQEFIGQGLSNIVGAFFSGYASSGSFNRSGVNFEAGARTPLASLFASLALLVVLLLIAPLAAYLPTAAMAGILFLVAWGLIDFHHIGTIWRTSKAESLVLGATMIGTVFNLEAGIFVGVFLSLVMFLYRSSRPEIVPVIPAPEEGAYHFIRANGRPECPQLRVVRINGALYFGAANHVQQALQQIDEDNTLQKSVLIAAASLNYVDVSGAEVLAQEARRRRRLGGGLYIYRLKSPLHEFLDRGGYMRDIGEDALFPVMSDVIGTIYRHLDPDVCRTCKARVFRQCRGQMLPDGRRRMRLMLGLGNTSGEQPATALALALAQRCGVTLDIAVLADSTASHPGHSSAWLPPTLATASTAAGVECQAIVRLGPQWVQEMLAAIMQADTHLLVIARRSTTGAPGTLSDAALKLIAQSPCHVLIASEAPQIWHRRILVSCDWLSEEGNPVDLALQMAKATSTAITLIGTASHQRRLKSLAEELAHQAALIRHQGTDCAVVTTLGSQEAAILASARDTGADLLILGSERGHAASRVGADVSLERLAAAFSGAILIVKPQDVLSNG